MDLSLRCLHCSYSILYDIHFRYLFIIPHFVFFICALIFQIITLYAVIIVDISVIILP